MKNFPGLVLRDGTYYVRMKVPADLLAALKRRELKRSLNTKDFRSARKEYQRVYGELLRIISQARRRLSSSAQPASDEILQEIVREWFFAAWDKCERGFDEPAPAGTDYDEMIGVAEMSVDSLSKPDQETRERLLSLASRLLKQHGYTAPEDSELERLGSYLRRGLGLINRAVVEHYRDGRHFHPIDDPLFQRNAPSTTISVSSGGPTVSELIERFKSDPQRKKLSPKNALGFQMSFRLLTEVAGANREVNRVSRDDARKIQTLLSALPPNATKKFRGVSLQRVAKLASESGLRPMEAGTAENILRNLSAFFAWAMREHHANRNPFEGLRPLQDEKSIEERRQPFDRTALISIFSAPLFTQREGIDRHPGRYWVPLIALYHGARSNEICQLEVADVGIEAGIPVFWIRKASAAGRVKRLKTVNAERTIPIHPKLLQLGFLEFVEMQRKAGHADLFPDVPPGSTGYRSDTFQKWFSRFRKSVGVVDRRMTFHGFRHNFSDAARAADIPGEIVDEIAGWSAGKSMRRHYGVGHTLARKQAEIAKISYPFLDRLLGSSHSEVGDSRPRQLTAA